MFHISVHSDGRQAPWIFSFLGRCHSISGLCRIIKNYSLPHYFFSETTTWCICTGLNTWSHFTCHNFEINNKRPRRFYSTTTYIDDELCTNCSSCGGQGVTAESLTLQWKDPSANQYGSIHMVVENVPITTNSNRNIPSHWNLSILYPVPPKLNAVSHK
jgi:hypothetical protein